MDTRKRPHVIMGDAPINNSPNHEEALSPFLCLPLEMREKIYSYCSPTALGLFAQTSKQHEADTAFIRLSQAAIHAAPEFRDADQNPKALAAIALLKKHPDLLFIKNRVKDAYGREIHASPYQIFLGAGDVWAINQVHKYILLRIKDGETKAAVQFQEHFPYYNKKLDAGQDEEARLYDNRNKQQIAEIVKQLAMVKQLIDADPFYSRKPLDTTQQAIRTLRQLFQPKPGEVIRSGFHFPPAILQEIYKTYYALHDR